MFDLKLKIYILGIGGIGVSALARLLKKSGHEVSGSDIVDTELTRSLRTDQIPVTIGNPPALVLTNLDLLIYSNAVLPTDPTRQWVEQHQVLEMSYPEALGRFSQDYDVIAVAGTNGKTTTTAMIATILEAAGLDPTVVVGSTVLAWGSNARLGKGKYLVLEADEYRRAFLHYHPRIAVITNIAPDHLDYYQDLEDIKQAFGQFANNIRPGGTLIYNSDDPNASDVAKGFSGNKIESGIRNHELRKLKLRVSGKFNLVNAAAAAEACKVLDVSDKVISEALQSFRGTWRRFELVASRFIGNREIQIISDYAHHPDGIRATLEMVADEFADKKVLVVFQPHQHNRTKMLFDDFVSAFCESKIENLVIAEIFDVAGREEAKDTDVSSRDLVRKIKKCGKKAQFARNLGECEKILNPIMSQYDMIVFMGAGDIYLLAERYGK